MAEENKKSFVFMESYREALDLLETDEEKYRFIMAIIDYGLYRYMPNLENESKVFKMGWLYTQPHLDASTRKRGGQPGNKNATGNHTKKQGRKRIKRIENESPNVNANGNANANANSNTNSYVPSLCLSSSEQANEGEEMTPDEWEAMIRALPI